MLTPEQIQHTRLKGELVFQGFCLRLVKAYWKDAYAQPHGRTGQRQTGADITGQDYAHGYRHAAVQCKASETDDPRELTETELIDEVEKAKSYEPKLDIFIVAYGGNRDAQLQKKAQKLSDANAANGLFKVVLWSWQDIIELALDFHEVIQYLMVVNRVSTVTSLDPKRPADEAGASFELSIQSAIAKLQAASAPPDLSAGGDPVLNAKLDVLRDQVRAGYGQAVVQPLREFAAQLPTDAHPKVRFRAYANLGAALAQSGSLEGAAIAFDTAADAEPGTSNSHSYRARAALFRNDISRAFDEAKLAMAIEPDQFSCTIYLETAPDDADPDALEKEVASVAHEIDVASSLARLFAGRGRHGDAIRLAKAISPEGWQKDGVLGMALLGEFEAEVALRVGAPMSPGQQHQVDEARVLLERAWSEASARNDSKNWTFLAANLCSVYRLVSDDDKADKLALEVYNLDPKAPTIAQRAALAHARRSDFAGAQSALAPLLDGDFDASIHLLAGNIATQQGAWNKVWSLGEAVYNQGSNDADRASAAELMVQAKARLTSLGDALTLADSLRSTFTSDIGFEGQVAEIARRHGDQGEIEKANARLATFGPVEDLTALQRFLLADAHADGGEWSRAVDLLEGLHTLDRPSEILKRRMFALFRAERRLDGRSLFESLRGEARQSPALLRLGAAIYERSGMLPQALQALTAALKQNANDLRSRLDWVRLHARNGTEDVVRRWIRRAEIPMDGDAEDLIELAQVLDRYGQRRKALDLGYATLKKNWGASERLHMAFMGLFLISSRSESFLRPKVVAEDSVVILATASGAQRRVRIEKTGSAEQEVLALDHPFAQQLLGKKTKDTVTQEPGIGEGTVWTIQEIKHKYLDLFHTVLEDHPTLFPHTRSFGKYTFDTEAAAESLEPIFEQSRRRSRTVDEAIRLYQEHPMPIDGIGKMLGMDGIDASRALRFGADVEFDSCLGLYEERERAIESLLSAPRVLVDAITLGIWNEIGLLDDLAAAGIRPNVVQATVDALSIRADEAKGETGRTGGHLGSQDGQIIYTEVSKAERREMARQAAALIDWVRANADILPTDVFQNDLLEQAKDVLSDSTMETINTGIAGGHVILMEDRRARQLAQAGGAEKTAWTQPLLMKLQYEGVISHDRYVALLAKMIVQKMSFVSLGADDLAQAASLGRDSQDFQAFCEAMMKPNVDAYSSVQVASDFITSLWQTDRPADLGLAGEILRRTILRRDDFRVFKGVVFQVDRNIKGFGFPFSLWSRLWIAYCENFISGHFIKNQVMALARRGK